MVAQADRSHRFTPSHLDHFRFTDHEISHHRMVETARNIISKSRRTSSRRLRKSSSILYHQFNLKTAIPATTQSRPIYWIVSIRFFSAPSQPYLSSRRLHVSIPQILVTNSNPTPTLAAKKANPVTNVPPMIPPSHDHQGRLVENTCGRCRRSRSNSTTASSNTVAVKIRCSAAQINVAVRLKRKQIRNRTS